MTNKTHHNHHYKNSPNLKITLIIILLITSLLCSSSRASLFDNTFHLRIANNMGPGWVLTAQCKSNNNEAREEELQPGEAMSMELTDELFNRTEVVCDFSGSGSGSGKKVSGHFKVFVEGETGYACGDVCKYSARDDGVWLFDFRDGEWDFKGAWVRH